MNILSHRGYWKIAAEKNLISAFERSFLMGFGTETDIRDCQGELVISHDMPYGNEMTLQQLIELVATKENTQIQKSLTLALNIKADGLANKIKETFRDYSQIDYFVFDMSVPDMRSYFNAGIPVFTRVSEIEKTPICLEQSSGIWLDSFTEDWFDLTALEALLEKTSRICIVSSELHSRSHDALWAMLKLFKQKEQLILCTDFPEAAAIYFHGEGCNES